MSLGIGAGLESMTANPMAWEGSVNPKVYVYYLSCVICILQVYLVLT